MTIEDAAAEPRPGEELDAGRLEEWLAGRMEGFSGPLEVRQFPAGFSNLTYLLRTPAAEWVLRRPPFGTRPRSGHDMGREFRVLSALRPRFRYCPRAVLFCDDMSVIGAPFYVAERIRGLILRRDYPAGLEPTPQLVRAGQQALADVLAELHAVDYVAAGLADLGEPSGYVSRQVEGWAARYERAATDDAADAREITDWLTARMPGVGQRHALLHNDYKLDNVVFDLANPSRLVGVLDWEMATLGDARMDLGCSLAYWVEPDDPPWLVATRTLPTHLPGSLSRTEFVDRYCQASGAPADDLRYFYVFGLFRLAVVVQQIYYRYRLGQTRDARFARLGPMVGALMRAAGEAAGGGLLGRAG